MIIPIAEILMHAMLFKATGNNPRNVVSTKENPSLRLAFLLQEIQATLVISNSNGPSETLRDIRTSTYQICRTEVITNRTTKFHK